MNVVLQRNSDDGKECKGTLTVTDPNITLFTCDTLERPNLNNAPDVSCIPSGIYQCEFGYMNDLKESHYQVLSVLNRTHIFIHEGSFVRNFEGCIGLGKAVGDINGDGEDDMVQTRNTISAFETIMNKEPFQFTILDVPHPA